MVFCLPIRILRRFFFLPQIISVRPVFLPVLLFLLKQLLNPVDMVFIRMGQKDHIHL